MSSASKSVTLGTYNIPKIQQRWVLKVVENPYGEKEIMYKKKYNSKLYLAKTGDEIELTKHSSEKYWVFVKPSIHDEDIYFYYYVGTKKAIDNVEKKILRKKVSII